MNKTQWAVEIFNKYGIKTFVDNNGMITISHYSQPKEKTFEELGINEDELIENVIACDGVFDTRKSSLKTFPLIASREIRMYKDNKITQMPNLKSVGILVANDSLKKLPKLKIAASISLENSPIKSLPKLKEVGILVAQNSALADLSSLEKVKKLCLIDCPVDDLKNLKEASDVFICSSDENNKTKLTVLNELESVENIFVANSELKSFPKLKKAQKIALFNTQIKSVKPSIGAAVEIGTKISDEELTQKFDTFTDWYNSDLLNQSMDLLGNIVNQIKS